MNSFQYAIAKAAWEGFRLKHGSDFDDLPDVEKRAWLAAAQAVLDTARRYASGWTQ
ncbi:MAG TPA: hypothetical protein VKF63_12870 [Terracidiphilus sp.]|nr:hypothetical protein [Terracidiphilus sp.]